MAITDIVINTVLGRVTRHPAGMHCPAWDDAFVSSLNWIIDFLGSTRSIEPNSYGNVAGWLSVTAGIVSKRLNLS